MYIGSLGDPFNRFIEKYYWSSWIKQDRNEIFGVSIVKRFGWKIESVASVGDGKGRVTVETQAVVVKEPKRRPVVFI